LPILNYNPLTLSLVMPVVIFAQRKKPLYLHAVEF
jgi:hypothetical protein